MRGSCPYRQRWSTLDTGIENKMRSDWSRLTLTPGHFLYHLAEPPSSAPRNFSSRQLASANTQTSVISFSRQVASMPIIVANTNPLRRQLARPQAGACFEHDAGALLLASPKTVDPLQDKSEPFPIPPWRTGDCALAIPAARLRLLEIAESPAQGAGGRIGKCCAARSS
jgi:hypothetical protein